MTNYFGAFSIMPILNDGTRRVFGLSRLALSSSDASICFNSSRLRSLCHGQTVGIASAANVAPVIKKAIFDAPVLAEGVIVAEMAINVGEPLVIFKFRDFLLIQRQINGIDLGTFRWKHLTNAKSYVVGHVIQRQVETGPATGRENREVW